MKPTGPVRQCDTQPMSLLSRRGFMKTLLVTAASPAPLWVDSSRASTWLPMENDQAAASVMLEHGGQRLQVSGPGSPFTFQNFLRVAGEWKPASLPGNVLVTGPSFPLLTSHVSSEASALICEGTATAEGFDGKSFSYRWKTEIARHGNGDEPAWFRFRTTLQLPQPIRLRQQNRVEPQIILWLNSTSTLMEGQSGSWRRVLLQQPTRNSLGAWGNDLPALYLLDQNVGVETMMYFDVGDMEWMSIENVPRFLVCRCTSVSRIERDGTQRLGVGLIADQATGNVLPAGDVRFTCWLLQRPVTSLLTEQQAVVRWMQALLPLFEENLAWPHCATSWREFAMGTIANLENKAQTRVEVRGHSGLRAYVKETSQLWKQPADNFELMTVADVLWPSLLYQQLHPSPTLERECRDLVADLPGFYHPDTHSVSNDYVRPSNERADSWYPFENSLIKYSMIGSLAASAEVKSCFLDAFQSARKMAHQYDYLFPIYYDVASLQARGAGTNYAVGGLYAWAAIIGHRLTGEAGYLEEARRAVQVLYTVPSERLFHEPQELAYGGLAAAELGLHDEATYLLYEQLRMFYWYSDPSQKNHDIRGMAQAAASILYPAFKENVEAILPWTGIMKRGIVLEGVLRFMDQQRRNNFSFFEKCSGDREKVEMAFIPFENLGTLELGGQTGNVGKEIYGAGECLWLYLMFEALGQVKDRELMMLNLDLLDVLDTTQFPPRQLHFVLYNPTAETRSARLAMPPARGRQVSLTANGKPVPEVLDLPARGILRLVAEF